VVLAIPVEPGLGSASSRRPSVFLAKQRHASEATLRDASEATLRDASEATLRDASEATLRDASEATLRHASEATLRRFIELGVVRGHHAQWRDKANPMSADVNPFPSFRDLPRAADALWDQLERIA
jgi:hypothetical protein